MEEYPHFPTVELIPNPENHDDDVNDHTHVGNPMSEKDASQLTSQPQNQSSLDNIGSGENINQLEAQLQRLRFDSVLEGLLERNSTNQQTLARNSRIGPSFAYEGAHHGNNIINQQTLAVRNSRRGLRHLYERALLGNHIINQQTLAAGNFGIAPSHLYERSPHGNDIINQQTLSAGNFGISPSHLYERSPHGNDIIKQQTLSAGNFGISPSHLYERSPHGNDIINQQTLSAGNFGIAPSHLYERSPHGNDIINQQTLSAGNFGIAPSHLYERSPHGNDIINQQTLSAGNFGIAPIHLYERSPHGNDITNQQTLTTGNSGIRPRHLYERSLNGNDITNQQTLAAARNSGIGPSHPYGGTLHGTNIIHQQTLAAGNLGIRPNHVYERALYRNNIIHQQILAAGDSGIRPSHAYNSSSIGRILMRHGYNNITSLEVVSGRVVSMSKEKDGSKFLVRVLDGKNLGDINFILSEVLDHLHDLMMDRFGKHVIEKIFDVLDVYQITPLFELITTNIFKFRIVCENDIGCRVVQSMIDHFTKEGHIILFARVLKEIAVSLATSKYGSYVLHHFLKLCPPSVSKDILDALANECTHIATDKIGCSILQKYLLDSSLVLISAVSDRVSLLAPHPYGNYVVQYVIGLRLPKINEEIVNQLRGGYVDLSLSNHGSNVVEKLLLFSNQENVGIIVKEIMDSPRFLELLRDDYGNYVAQRALECSQGALYDKLERIILKHYTNLYTHRFGKRVLAFMYGVRKFYDNVEDMHP